MIDEREKKIILLVASLSSFLVPFMGSSITVALPSMATQFHTNAVTLGWITSAYILSAAVFRSAGMPISSDGRTFFWPAFSSFPLHRFSVRFPPQRSS